MKFVLIRTYFNLNFIFNFNKVRRIYLKSKLKFNNKFKNFKKNLKKGEKNGTKHQNFQTDYQDKHCYF